MSKLTPHDLQCPHCGNEQETRVWDSLNVTLDPELKEKLYRGEVNQFECEKCGQKTFIDAPLLYHDMTQKFCVQYYPPNALKDTDFLKNFNSDGWQKSMLSIPKELCKYLQKPHVVFDMNEMIRYVLFRDLISDMAEK